MVFSSVIFLMCFLPITLLVYYIVPKKLKNIWLLLMSLIFFAWGQPQYLWIILFSIFINYIGGSVVYRLKNLGRTKICKLAFILTIILNLSTLFYYKYAGFTVDIINDIFRGTINIKEVALPIGISFFTFQGMSYVIDVYKGDVAGQRNILTIALYITLFPQLVAGPIVRYNSIEREFKDRRCSLEDIVYGTKRFIIGLFKKVVIANTMAGMADAVWSNISSNTPVTAWIGIFAYTLQIFFDFSGYSDMAIGLGRMFGFHFMENFNLPYISKSIREFWRRWHISLGSWFRDYVYIPLGGSRKHVYFNLLVVFFLTGLWHGAAWQFILWGLWHGIFMLIERVTAKRNFKLNLPLKLNAVLSHLYTMFVVIIGWVFFRASSLPDAMIYLKTMFGFTDISNAAFSVQFYINKYTALILILGIILSTPVLSKLWAAIKAKVNTVLLTVIRNIGLLLMLIYSVIRIVSNTYNPFIYFQF